MDTLTQTYQAELKKTRLAVADRVAEMFRTLPNYYDDQVPGFVARAVPVVQAGQQRAIALTNAYSARKLGVQPVGVDTAAIIEGIRGDVTPQDVYARPFVTVRSAIMSVGISTAVVMGINRLRSTANMDVQMASRDALGPLANALGQRVTGWTRVAEPSCCDFCQELDGVTTGPTEPQPLHNNCGCTAEPNVSGLGIESVAAGAVFGMVEIRDHGELGPVITDKHDDFTSELDFTSKQKRLYQDQLLEAD